VPKGSRRGAREAEALAQLRTQEGPVLRGSGGERVEDGHVVRMVGASATVYLCPGCSQDVVAVPHVVAWPEGDLEWRRHWHTPCWDARARRRPTERRLR
jgi:hypothetical protein